MLHINKKIEQAMVAANLTQDELAQKLGIKRSTYQYWEKKTPTIDKIKAVTKALNLPEDYFFNAINIEEDNPEGNSELVEILKDDREFFKELVRTNLNLISINLNELLQNQRFFQAQFRATVKRESERFLSTEDPVAVKKELDKISIYAAEYMGLNDGVDSLPNPGI